MGGAVFGGWVWVDILAGCWWVAGPVDDGCGGRRVVGGQLWGVALGRVGWWMRVWGFGGWLA